MERWFEYGMLTKGDFQKSELAGWTMDGPVILTMKKTFSNSFFFAENHLLGASYVEFN